MENKLGTYLKDCRNGKSLRDFAKILGISHTHLDSLEKGVDPRTGKKVNVTVDVLLKISSALNLDIRDLILLAIDSNIAESIKNNTFTNIKNQSEASLSDNEKEFLSLYRKLDENSRRIILNTMENTVNIEKFRKNKIS